MFRCIKDNSRGFVSHVGKGILHSSKPNRLALTRLSQTQIYSSTSKRSFSLSKDLSYPAENRSKSRSFGQLLRDISNRTFSTEDKPEYLYKTSEPLLSYKPPHELVLTPGLFGVIGLHRPDDFMLIAENKYIEAKFRVDLIKSNPISSSTIQWIDDISKLLCDITDVAEMCRNIHVDEQWINVSQDVWMRGQDFMAELSLDPCLIHALVAICEDVKLWNSITMESRRVVMDLLVRTSKKETDDDINEFQMNLSQESLQTETDFASENITPTLISLGIKTLPADMEMFEKSGYIKHVNGILHVINHPQILNEILSISPDAKLRKTVFNGLYSVYRHRHELLSKLLYQRYLISSCNNHLSFAHEASLSLLCKDPVFTIERLINFVDMTKPSLNREYDVLTQMLNKPFKSSSHRLLDKIIPQQKTVLQASDVRYLMNLANLAVTPQAFSKINQTTNEMNDHVTSDGENVAENDVTIEDEVVDPVVDEIVVDSTLESSTETANASQPPVQTEESIQDPSQTNTVPEVTPAPDATVKSKTSTPSPASIYDSPTDEVSNVDQTLNLMNIYEYFPVASVLEGIDSLCRAMLGVHIRIDPITLAEDWTIDQKTKKNIFITYYDKLKKSGSTHDADPSTLPSPSQNIYKIALIDSTDNAVRGYIYLDLFERETKNLANVQFVRQCSRVSHNDAMTPPVTVAEAEALGPKGPGFDPAVSCVVLQVPIMRGSEMVPNDIYLDRLKTDTDIIGDGLQSLISRTLSAYPEDLHNLLPSIFTPHVARMNRFPLCMSHDHVHVLMHEIGHATQTILSRTQYQHLSGSRCEMDFAETPSTLFENFSLNPLFLNTFAKHYYTQEPIPQEAISMISMKKDMFAAMDANSVAVRALIDQRLHGIPVPYEPNNTFPFLKLQENNHYAIDEKFQIPLVSQGLVDNFTTEQFTNNLRLLIEDKKSIFHRRENFPLNEANISQIVRQFYQHYFLTDLGEYHNPQLGNTHLGHYGGVFFTYLFCSAYANLVFEVIKPKDPQSKLFVDPVQGRRYRDIVLKSGGRRNGLDMLADMLELPGEEYDFTVPDHDLSPMDVVWEAVKGIEGVTPENATSDKYIPVRAQHILSQNNTDKLSHRQRQVIDRALNLFVKKINTHSNTGIDFLTRVFKLEKPVLEVKDKKKEKE